MQSVRVYIHFSGQSVLTYVACLNFQRHAMVLAPTCYKKAMQCSSGTKFSLILTE